MGATGSSAFLTSQAELVWTSITTCWSADVFIPDLAPRFWKLTLQVECFSRSTLCVSLMRAQLLSRYKSWLQASLPLVDPPTKSLATDKVCHPSFVCFSIHCPKGSLPQSRASTPQPNQEVSPENSTADDPALKQYSIVLVDIKVMHDQALALWQEKISTALPEPIATEDTNDTAECASSSEFIACKS